MLYILPDSEPFLRGAARVRYRTLRVSGSGTGLRDTALYIGQKVKPNQQMISPLNSERMKSTLNGISIFRHLQLAQIFTKADSFHRLGIGHEPPRICFSSAEIADDCVAKFTSLVRARD